jgi:branched-chain amino acid aminotransferase
MFGAGTAAVISPIAGFGYQENDFELLELENPYAAQLKENDYRHTKPKITYGWRVFVK